MDISELESVCAVDTYRNYSEAADGIASSPAVISKHVSKVEKELGVRIFERASKTRPVELTSAGAELIGYFHSMLDLYKRALEKANEINHSPSTTLVIGCTPFIGNFHEADILAQFSINNPEITIKRRILSVPKLLNMVSGGTADAIFLPLMQNLDINFRKYPVLSEPNLIIDEVFRLKSLTLGIPDNHPLAQCSIISKDMFPLLHNETFLFSCAQQAVPYSDQQRDLLHTLLGFKGTMKVRFVDYSEPTVALKLVESGAGILPQACIVPKKVGKVNFIPVENDMITTALYYVQRKNNTSTALKKLRAHVNEFSSSVALE